MNMTLISGQLGIPSSSSGEENSKNNDVICAMLFGLLLNRILLLFDKFQAPGTISSPTEKSNIFASGSAMSTKILPLDPQFKNCLSCVYLFALRKRI